MLKRLLDIMIFTVFVVELMADGSLLRNDRDAVDVIAAAAEHHPDVIVNSTERLGDEFFRLRTGIAGQVVQRFLTYRLRLVVMGRHIAAAARKLRAPGLRL